MTVENILDKHVGIDILNPYPNVKDAMKEYARLKCEELLEIVAEKAKIIDEDGDVYQQPKGFYCNGELYETWVDKDSILNAVDLDSFIS